MSKVLLIEDFAVIRRLIEVALIPLDIDLNVVNDGETGLSAVEAERPDLVLLDIGLPGIDGWEVIERLRQSHSMGELPILVVTAHGDHEDEVRALSLGANGFIVKPFQPDDLMEAVEKLLRGSLTV